MLEARDLVTSNADSCNAVCKLKLVCLNSKHYKKLGKQKFKTKIIKKVRILFFFFFEIVYLFFQTKCLKSFDPVWLEDFTL